MNFPLNRARNWRGSFPMTTLTCTGAPLYLLSMMSAWVAHSAISSLLAWRPCSRQSFRQGKLRNGRRLLFLKRYVQMKHQPATCTGCNAADRLSGTCTEPGSSPLRKTARTCSVSRQPAPSSQAATPTSNTSRTNSVSFRLKSCFLCLCVGVYYWRGGGVGSSDLHIAGCIVHHTVPRCQFRPCVELHHIKLGLVYFP